jgi:hypothetical protein
MEWPEKKHGTKGENTPHNNPSKESGAHWQVVYIRFKDEVEDILFQFLKQKYFV